MIEVAWTAATLIVFYLAVVLYGADSRDGRTGRSTADDSAPGEHLNCRRLVGDQHVHQPATQRARNPGHLLQPACDPYAVGNRHQVFEFEAYNVQIRRNITRPPVPVE